MQSVLIVVHILIVVSLIVVVLLQRSEGGALGTGGGTGSFMTGRGQANALSRATAALNSGVCRPPGSRRSAGSTQNPMPLPSSVS